MPNKFLQDSTDGKIPEKNGADKIYRAAIGWRIASLIFLVLCTLLGISMMILPFFDEDIQGLSSKIGIMVVGVLFTLLFAVIFSSLLVEYLKITQDEIIDRCMFRTKRLKFSEVKGYKIVRAQYNSILVFYPISTENKPVKVGLIVENKEELIQWTKDTFVDLSEEIREKEETEIISNEVFGKTEEARRYELKKAQRWVQVITTTSVVLLFWAFIFPKPYLLVITLLSILPFITLLLIPLFKGIVKIDGRQDGAYPNVLYPFMSPGMALMLRAIFDTSPLNFIDIIFPGVLISLAIWGLVLITDGKSLQGIGSKVALLFFSSILGFSLTVIHNELFDESIPEKHIVKVIDKRVSRGKTTSYYFKVEPWEHRKNADEISTYRVAYENVDVGDSITINLKQGLFSIPWFYLTPATDSKE